VIVLVREPVTREDRPVEEIVEFDSMINVRPSQGNRSRSVDDPARRQQVRSVVNRLVTA